MSHRSTPQVRAIVLTSALSGALSASLCLAMPVHAQDGGDGAPDTTMSRDSAAPEGSASADESEPTEEAAPAGDGLTTGDGGGPGEGWAPIPGDKAPPDVPSPAAAVGTGIELDAPDAGPASLDVIMVRRLGRPLEWRWRRVGLGDYVLAGASVATLAAMAAVEPLGTWSGPVGLDEDVRAVLRLDSKSNRLIARDASDVLLATLASYPLIVDSLFVTAYYRRSEDAAIQMALVTVETLIVTAALTQTVKTLLGRERPYGRRCGEALDPETLDCRTSDRERSFFSGHSSAAFAAASVICAHHANLPLYGGGAWDAVPCAAGYALAASTAALRVLSDRHYFSDVMVGAATGTLVGLGLPYLLFYAHGDASASPRDGDGIEVRVVPQGTGLAAVGVF